MTQPVLATNGPGGRWYEIPHPIIDGGFRGPSVTTILSNGIPAPALKRWGEGMVATYAVDNHEAWSKLDRRDALDLLKRAPYNTMNRAGARGTDIHAIAERVIAGIDPQSWEGQTYGKFAQYIADFLDDYEVEIIGSERTVANTIDNYAGSYDLLATINGKVTLIDWKTSKGVYGKFGVQLAAYANANIQIVGQRAEPMPTVEQLAIVHLTEVGYRYVPVVSNIQDLYEVFRAAQAIANFTVTGEHHTLGEPEEAIPTSQVRNDLIQQVRDLITAHPAAAQELANAWPAQIPTFKSDHKHTRRELYVLAAAINRIERNQPPPTGAHYANGPQKQKVLAALATVPKKQLEQISQLAAKANIPVINTEPVTVEQVEQMHRIIQMVSAVPQTRRRQAICKTITDGRTNTIIDLNATETAAFIEAAQNQTGEETP